jgi:hypothetical protein
MKQRKQSRLVTISVPDDFIELLRIQAEKNHMTISYYIRHLVRKDEKENS